MIRSTATLVLVFAVTACADVISYECTSFPENEGWERSDRLFLADRWIDSGLLVQYAEIVDAGPPEVPEDDFYFRSLGQFAGSGSFFVDWRMETDGPREGIPACAPAGLVAGGMLAVHYHFTIAEDQVRFLRDPTFPIVWIDIEPGVPHTYRLELYGGEFYTWYIDGQLVDCGVPEGQYPTSDSRITFGSSAAGGPITTRWDYIRYGTIPDDGSGDFDSDADRDLRDFYFFEECLRNGGSGTDAAPSCTWADMDADGDADLLDFADFQVAFTPE